MSQNALTDDPQASRSENALAARLLMAVVVLLAVCAAMVALFGLPALGILGLIGTALTFAALLTIMAGN
ncbi:hypothetical protein FQV27_09820 [Paracoccus aurantiacus]|uniref:Uncharacterized protein n=1 Tax=Paracoccus aurantiacus TaxID=2599412 RepID=A0A5C6S4S5_9RHOB|nr:hypothetical protein [Paracoccus aurantiacus]TXB69247.1 hypothetical protein FQV27_09820 [Paracoccus aurantiacus]